MKKLIAALLCTVLCFSLVSCNVNTTDKKSIELEFSSTHVRTNGYHEDVKYPVVKLVRSVDELEHYYNLNKDRYSLGRRDPADSHYVDYTIGFLDACDKYDEAYFKENVLLLVLLEEGSGSIRHSVDSVQKTDDKIRVNISRISPEIGTCDMAEWHVFVDLSEKDVTYDTEVEVLIDGINPLLQPTTLYESGDFSNITLSLPYNWDFETERTDDRNYAVYIWPKERKRGKLKIMVTEQFGVCGTGLTEEIITLGEYKACKGAYKDSWDFISYLDTPCSYVVLNEDADEWWNEYGEEAMLILSTAKIADGMLFRDEAIALAKKAVTVEYDEVIANFDMQEGNWVVTFYKENTAGGDQTVTLTYEGKIIDMQYGE